MSLFGFGLLPEAQRSKQPPGTGVEIVDVAGPDLLPAQGAGPFDERRDRRPADSSGPVRFFTDHDRKIVRGEAYVSHRPPAVRLQRLNKVQLPVGILMGVHLVEQLRCVEVSAAVHQPDGLRVQIPGEGEGVAAAIFSQAEAAGYR